MNTETAPKSAPNAAPAAAPKPAPVDPKTKSRKPLVIVTLVLIVAAIVGASLYLANRNYESTDDAFIEGHVIQISAKVSAHIVGVSVLENDEVKKGDLLLELDPRDFQVALEKAQAQLGQAKAQAQQAKAQAAVAQAQILQAGAQLAQAQAQAMQQTAQFEVAGINFNRNQSLYQKDLRAVAKEEVDTTKASFDAAKGAVDAANANIEAVRSAGEAAKATAGAAEAQAGAAEAAVVVAEAAVHDAELQLSYTKIVAPVDGRVTRKNVEVGNYVQPAQTLMSLVQHDVWVTANFKETQLTRVKEGQPVEVRVDTYPDRKFKAHVQSVQLGSGSRFSLLPAENATGNFVKVVQRVPIKILFDEPLDALRQLAPGMSVEPRVDVSAKQ